MQCRMTLTTEVQQPWPAMLVSHIQADIKSKSRPVQQTVIVLFLEPWQIKQMQGDQWVSEMCSKLRAHHGITCFDIKVEVINDGNG
jgi:hypothetical protein